MTTAVCFENSTLGTSYHRCRYEPKATMLTADDVADAIMLAVKADQRVSLEEFVIKPRHRRDFSGELTDSLSP